jgi:hypothetical protein
MRVAGHSQTGTEPEVFMGRGQWPNFFFLVGTKYTKFLLLPYIF